jgi:hypothetical protein
MCGNIKKLRYPDRPATDAEIAAAVLQYVRKISNVREPSAENRVVFDEARLKIERSVKRMLEGLKAPRVSALKKGGFKPV